MPVFVDDPVLLSKERLKSELVAHSVPLPPGEKKKQVYLELYLKHVAHKKPADFSSDEEEEDGAPEGELETVIEEEDEDKNTEVMDVYQLTDEQLKGELIKHGVKPGPIVASTRALYEKKLQRLVDPSRKPAPELAQNSTHDASQYSDSEEDETGSEYEPQRAVTGTGRAHHGHSQLSQHREGSPPKNDEDFYFYPQCFSACQRTVKLRNNPAGECVSTPDKSQGPGSQSAPIQRATFTGIPADPGVSPPLYSSLQASNAASPAVSAGAVFSITKLVEELESRSPSTPPLKPPRRGSDPSCITASPKMKGGLIMVDKDTMTSNTPKHALKGSLLERDIQGEYRPRKEDVLEEMFPDEVRTPTGISATRRRPIKGAAGRPVQFKYSEMVPHSRPLQQEKQEELRCFVPIWIQVLVFFALAGFFLFVYYTMNSLSEYTEISGQGSEVTQEQLPAAPQEAAMAQDTPLHTFGQE
nr:PREDICTED: LEM domain-containing protein 1 isoform X1 [Lepisosteus oculatus]XP_015198292.1 PREDICTED: LEM domain-containing protein 1 isoform X1 [Lepisosteus oculatus]